MIYYFSRMLLIFSLSFNAYAVDYDEDYVKYKIQQWIDAISSGDVQQIVNLYADDAILLPTLSDNIKTTQQERKNYFSKLVQLKDLRVYIDDYVGIHLTDMFYVSNGNYSFVYDENGETVYLPARFTFVYHYDGNDLKIYTHHSSVRPDDL